MKKFEKIIIRPHHLICALLFQGKGYSKEFIDNFYYIIDKIEKGNLMEITYGCDDICSCCPNKIKNKCKNQKKVTALDKNYIQLLNIQEGEFISWSEVENLIQQKLNLKSFHKICEDCDWYSVCEKSWL